MPKLFLELTEPSSTRRRMSVKTVLVCVLALLIAPPLYELSSLCVARWQGMYGVFPHVQTPILDAVTRCLAAANTELGDFLNPIFRRVPWKPGMVLPIAFVWTGLAVLLIRKI